jgi:multidrug resistance efflux pump
MAVASPSSPGVPAPAAPPAPATPATPTRRRGLPRLVLPIILIALIGGGIFGYRYWQDQRLFVSTDNALITGALVQMGTLNSGRVNSVAVDIGDTVTKNQTVATVVLPSSLGNTPIGTPKLEFRGTEDQQVAVRAPIDGVVVARSANPGDTVATGQSLLTVIDQKDLWVQAQIEETKISRVAVGETVEVSVDTLGRTLPGKVVAVGRASSATFSLLPQGSSSGNFTKVTQLVPVKIALDYGNLPLVFGSSVEVKIRVQQ